MSIIDPTAPTPDQMKRAQAIAQMQKNEQMFRANLLQRLNLIIDMLRYLMVHNGGFSCPMCHDMIDTIGTDGDLDMTCGKCNLRWRWKIPAELFTALFKAEDTTEAELQ